MDLKNFLFILLLCINYVAGDLLQMTSTPINMTRIIKNITGQTITACYMECTRENGCQSIAITEGAANQLSTCHLLKMDNGYNDGGNLMTTIEAIGSEPTVHGQWGCWVNTSSCNASCGGGYLNQTRECDSPEPKQGGDNCTGLAQRIIRCNTHSCPAVNGQWGMWHNETACTASCEGGTMSQTRKCDSPKPKHGGDDCVGKSERTIDCNTQPCPAVNIALFKRATQTLPAAPYIASNGNDGNIDTRTLTHYRSYPWWEVDLAADVQIEYFILRVLVSPHKDDVRVLGKTSTDSSFQTCKDPVNIQPDVVRFFCDANRRFRYIRIEKLSSGHLSINEFEVYVKKN